MQQVNATSESEQVSLRHNCLSLGFVVYSIKSVGKTKKPTTLKKRLEQTNKTKNNDCQPNILAGEVDVKLNLLFLLFVFSRICFWVVGGFLLVVGGLFLRFVVYSIQYVGKPPQKHKNTNTHHKQLEKTNKPTKQQIARQTFWRER
jgi:hypothetical protein